jgi:hypothetical protein
VYRSSSSKQANTNCSRKDHYLRWCREMEIEARGMNEQDLQAHTFIITCYTISHVQDKTLMSRK